MIATRFAFASFAVRDVDAAHDFYGRVLGLDVGYADMGQLTIDLPGGGLDQDARGISRGIAAGRGPDIAWFTDPAGNIISVLQNPPGDDAA